jgi:hypothetical protein
MKLQHFLQVATVWMRTLQPGEHMWRRAIWPSTWGGARMVLPVLRQLLLHPDSCSIQTPTSSAVAVDNFPVAQLAVTVDIVRGQRCCY